MKESIFLNSLTPYKYYLISLCFIVISCNSNSGNYSNYSSKEMLAFLSDSVISPKLNDYKSSVTELNTLISSFSSPSNDEFIRAQELWKISVLNWSFIETGYVGKLKDSFLKGKIYNESDKSKIDDLLLSTEDVNSDEFLKTVSNKNRGFLALDYLLFTQDAYLNITQNERYRNVLIRLTSLLHQNSIELYKVFIDQHNAIRNATESGEFYTREHDLLTEYINAFIVQLESYRDLNIGKILGKNSGGTPDPELIEARFSGISKQILVEKIASFKQFFFGTDTYGFDDLLKDRGSDLGETLRTDISTLEELVNDLPSDFTAGITNQEETFESVYGQLTVSLRRIKNDIASFLGTSINFSDNDGD